MRIKIILFLLLNYLNKIQINKTMKISNDPNKKLYNDSIISSSPIKSDRTQLTTSTKAEKSKNNSKSKCLVPLSLITNYESLPKNVIEQIQCQVCMGLIINPVDCLLCEDSFCKECLENKISNNLSCFNGCFPVKYKEVSKSLMNLFNNIEIKCFNHLQGCKEIIKYDELCKYASKEEREKINSNQNSQDHSNIKTNNIDNKNNIYNKSNCLYSHLDNCIYRNIICSSCNKKCVYNEYQKHIRQCKEEIKQSLNNNKSSSKDVIESDGNKYAEMNKEERIMDLLSSEALNNKSNSNGNINSLSKEINVVINSNNNIHIKIDDLNKDIKEIKESLYNLVSFINLDNYGNIKNTYDMTKNNKEYSNKNFSNNTETMKESYNKDNKSKSFINNNTYSNINNEVLGLNKKNNKLLSTEINDVNDTFLENNDICNDSIINSESINQFNNTLKEKNNINFGHKEDIKGFSIYKTFGNMDNKVANEVNDNHLENYPYINNDSNIANHITGHGNLDIKNTTKQGTNKSDSYIAENIKSYNNNYNTINTSNDAMNNTSTRNNLLASDKLKAMLKQRANSKSISKTPDNNHNNLNNHTINRMIPKRRDISNVSERIKDTLLGNNRTSITRSNTNLIQIHNAIETNIDKLSSKCDNEFDSLNNRLSSLEMIFSNENLKRLTLEWIKAFNQNGNNYNSNVDDSILNSNMVIDEHNDRYNTNNQHIQRSLYSDAVNNINYKRSDISKNKSIGKSEANLLNKNKNKSSSCLNSYMNSTRTSKSPKLSSIIRKDSKLNLNYNYNNNNNNKYSKAKIEGASTIYKKKTNQDNNSIYSSKFKNLNKIRSKTPLNINNANNNSHISNINKYQTSISNNNTIKTTNNDYLNESKQQLHSNRNETNNNNNNNNLNNINLQSLTSRSKSPTLTELKFSQYYDNMVKQSKQASINFNNNHYNSNDIIISGKVFKEFAVSILNFQETIITQLEELSSKSTNVSFDEECLRKLNKEFEEMIKNLLEKEAVEIKSSTQSVMLDQSEYLLGNIKDIINGKE